MRLWNKIKLFSIGVVWAGQAFAQSNYSIGNAYQNYRLHNVKQTIEICDSLLKSPQMIDSQKSWLYYYMAKSYFWKGQHDSSAYCYLQSFVLTKKESVLIEAIHEYKRAMRYEIALSLLDEYKSDLPDDFYSTEVVACTGVKEKLKNGIKFQALPVMELNTEYGDFSLNFIDPYYKNAVFTSTRKFMDKEEGVYAHCNFFMTRHYNGAFSSPVQVDTRSNGVNNAGVLSANYHTNQLYFTQCGTVDNNTCKIYWSYLTGDMAGESYPLEMKDVSFYDRDEIYGHPYYSNELKVLVFVSDRKGGYGGKDLWYTTFLSDEGVWSKPVNMGRDINSEGDEMFPYISPSGKLYYSSDGFGALGGLDIYSADKETKRLSWFNRQALAYPINSSGDDFSITVLPGDTCGYFSTNREGCGGRDDIFYFSPAGSVKVFASSNELTETDSSLQQALHKFYNETVAYASVLNASLQVTPNPNNGTFSVQAKLKSVQPVLLRIHTVNGTVVYKQDINPETVNIQQQVQLNSPDPGSYYIQLLSGNQLLGKVKILIR